MMRYAFILRHYIEDPKEAAKFYIMATEEGSVEAMIMCGYIYLVGEGVSVRETKSRGCLRPASDNHEDGI